MERPAPPLRTRDHLQHPLVVTVGVIISAGVLLMYVLLSRHLRSVEDIALALSERMGDQEAARAKEAKALAESVANGTRLSSAAFAHPLEMQAELLRSISAQVGNASAALRAQLQAQSVAQEEQLRELGDEMRSRVEAMAALLPAPASRTAPNLTVLIAAGLRLQKRMHEDIGKVLDNVGSKPQDTGTAPGMLQMLQALKRQNEVVRSMQDSIDALTEKLEVQAQEEKGQESAKDKRMLSVLRALVAYLKSKEKRPSEEEEQQARVEELLTRVLTEVRNKTMFVSLLRTMRAQTAIMSRLGARVGGLETKVLRAQLGGSTGDDDEAEGGGAAAAAATGGASRVAAATASAITETQNLVQILTKEVQKQTESIAELQGVMETGRGGGGGGAAAFPGRGIVVAGNEGGTASGR